MSQPLATTPTVRSELHHLQSQNEELRRYLAAQRVVITSLERRIGKSLDSMGIHCDQLQSVSATPNWKEHLVKLQNEVDGLSDLLADTMLLQKLEAGKVELRLESIELRALLLSVSRHLQAPTPDSPCRLILELADFLPSAMADRELLEAVITDLLARGTRYSEPTNPVILGAELMGDRTLIKVTAQRFAPPGNRDFATEIVLCCRRIEVQGGEISCQPGPGGKQTVVICLRHL